MKMNVGVPGGRITGSGKRGGDGCVTNGCFAGLAESDRTSLLRSSPRSWTCSSTATIWSITTDARAGALETVSTMHSSKSWTTRSRWVSVVGTASSVCGLERRGQ